MIFGLNDTFYLNLHDIEFVKVTIKRRKENDVLYEILEFNDNCSELKKYYDDEIEKCKNNIVTCDSIMNREINAFEIKMHEKDNECKRKLEQKDMDYLNQQNTSKSSLEQIQKEYQSSIEQIQKDHDSILEQNQKQYENEITKQRKFYEKERDRTSEECGNRIYEYNNDRALCYEREKSCINENFELKCEIKELKKLMDSKNQKESTQNTTIIICAVIIVLLFTYFLFNKR